MGLDARSAMTGDNGRNCGAYPSRWFEAPSLLCTGYIDRKKWSVYVGCTADVDAWNFDALVECRSGLHEALPPDDSPTTSQGPREMVVNMGMYGTSMPPVTLLHDIVRYVAARMDEHRSMDLFVHSTAGSNRAVAVGIALAQMLTTHTGTKAETPIDLESMVAEICRRRPTTNIAGPLFRKLHALRIW